jgi:16S rRNA (cytosine1402-N4)-methyltransferase
MGPFGHTFQPGLPARSRAIRLAMPESRVHVPVMLEEVLALLGAMQEGGPGAQVYVDCTAGLGGHAAAVAARILRGGGGVVVLNDADPGNIAAAESRIGEVLQGGPGVQVVPLHGNFAEVPRKLRERGLAADMVLADLGFASPQMEDPARGLSFQRDGPLDMRLDPTSPVTAAELVASLTEQELERILREYGEERESRRIARKLVDSRRTAPISTTGQLAQLVRSAMPRRSGSSGGSGGIDPATRTFQALRIAVNDELGSLESLLDAVKRGAREVAEGKETWLKPGARVAIISFHSLEDRPVKRAFAELVSAGWGAPVTGKPVGAGEDEMRRNPRARSAKLRVVRVGVTMG